ncbi:hypothetical protein Mm0Y_03835 [Morganella morganii]|nr:hypothetical protein Mm0Y_03835 [Morganella morganii]
MLQRSEGLGTAALSVTWRPLDSPTAVENADIQLKQAQTDSAYAAVGAVDGLDIRKKLAADKESAFYGIDVNEDDYAPENTGTNPPGGYEGQTPAVSGSGPEPLSA